MVPSRRKLTLLHQLNFYCEIWILSPVRLKKFRPLVSGFSATFAVAGAPFASLAAAAQARVVLARGERDPMVSLEELRAHAREAHDIPGTGHNAHVENPRAVLGLIEVLLNAD